MKEHWNLYRSFRVGSTHRRCDRKSVRVCADFRMTVNPVSKLNRYLISKVEDIFATLKEGITRRHHIQ